MLPCVSRAEAARAVWSLCYDVIGGLNRLHKAYGPAIAVNSPLASRQTPPIAYLFSGAALNEAVYEQMDHLRLKGVWPNPAPRGTSQEKLRFNYMSLGGGEHHHYARQISGQFGRPRAERLFDDMRAIVDQEISAWPTGKTVDIANLTRALATRCALQMLYGETNRERALKIGRMIDRYHAMNWSASVMMLRLNLPGLPYRKLLNIADELFAEVERWTDDSRRLPSANLRGAFRELIEPSGSPAPDAFKIANIATTAWASYEPPGIAMAWTLMLLEQHPLIAEALLAELESSGELADHTVASIGALPILDAVVFESLRLLPPTPIIGMWVMKDLTIAGTKTRKGSSLLLSPYLTQRDPAIYPAPDRFRPDRWLKRRPTAYEFIVFSGGARRCSGYHYAVLLLKVAIAAIVRRYRVALDPAAKYGFIAKPTLRPSPGMPARILPQDGAFERTRLRGRIAGQFTPEDRPLPITRRVRAETESEYAEN
jgi:cytochrome P450